MKSFAAGGSQKRWRIAALPVAIALILAGCAPTGGGTETPNPDGQPVDGGVLKVSWIVAPLSLDPVTGAQGTDHVSLWPMFDRLVNFTPDLQPLPGLATEWEYTDETTLVMQIRPDVLFQDGTPLDAEAVKFNIDRARLQENSAIKSNLASITDVAVTGDLEVTITTSRPDTSLPMIFADRAGMMGSPTAIEADLEGFALNPVGAGAFSFVSYSQGETLVLEKNPDYWDAGKPYLDGIQIDYLGGQTAVNALVSGQTNVAVGVPAELVASLETNENIVVTASDSFQQEGCYFNFDRQPFDKVEARQALMYALDKEAMRDAFTFGTGGVVAHQLFPEGYWAYDPTLEYPFEQDIDKAKELWAAAGGEGHVITAVIDAVPRSIRESEILQDQLAQAGIEMEITQSTSPVADWRDNKAYDLWCAGWSGRPDPSGTLSSVVSPSGFYNVGAHELDGVDVDELIAAGNAVSDPADRAAAIAPLLAAAQEQVAFLNTVFIPMIVAADTTVKGYVTDIYGKPNFTFTWLAQ